jgi:hypothetical protein
MNKFLLLSVIVMSASIPTVFLNGSYAGTQESVKHQKDAGMVSQEDDSSLSGKVVETMDSGGYTYVNIEKNGKKTWVAVPQMKVTVGQNISFEPGMVMRDFTSKTLKRTFDAIVFSPGVAGQGAGTDFGSAHHKKPDVSSSKPITVEKASGPDAYTIAELYKKGAALDKKGVVIRGQVVKFSANIMGKNWIHIQDGSGDSSEGTHDIPVTSQDAASVGDIITVKGTLYKDKDFGSGYKYSVIIEDASIKK